MQPSKATGTYLDVEFQVDQYWRFYVPALEERFDSHKAMTEKIERVQKAENATARKKLNIPAILSDSDQRSAVDCVITGVHAGHGKIVTKPQSKRYNARLYPSVDWIKSAIQESHTLRERADAISECLFKYSVNIDANYGYSTESHGERVAQVEKDIEEKRKKAENSSLEKELAKKEQP